MTSRRGLLVYIPWPSNTGYAMHRAESQFYEIGRRYLGGDENVHFAFTSLGGGPPTSLPDGFDNVHQLDIPKGGPFIGIEAIRSLIRTASIDVFLGYDLPVRNDAYPLIRDAGVETILSYWGAPMSSINTGLRLALKRLEVRAYRSKPDHFVFQSKAMQETAVRGRGIPESSTSVVSTGVNVSRLIPRAHGATHVHEAFGIPTDRRIVVFSGHVRERKGVGALLAATKELVVARNRENIHVLILGAIDDLSERFVRAARDGGIDGFVTFGGYRSDIFELFSGCWLGVTPSTGWDSFPRSVLEMQGTGLPVVVSDCQGLPEMVEDGVTGSVVEAGDHLALADAIEFFVDDEEANARFGARARERILRDFTEEGFIDRMVDLLGRIHARTSASP